MRGEPSGVWRAGARTGHSRHISKVWGENIPDAGCFIVVCSRVTEKSGLYTGNLLYAVLEVVAERWGLDNVQEAWFCSDPGSHYRCKEVVAAMSDPILQLVRAGNGSIDNEDHDDHGMATVYQMTGVESHSKNEEDQMASELERRVRNNETRLEINDTGELIEVWRDGFKNKDSSQPVEIFLDYMPEHSKEEWEATVAKLTTTSFPIGVQACHVWKHTTKDKRRRSLWSANGHALTGVATACWPMPGDVGVRGKATSGTLRRKMARGQGQGAAPKLRPIPARRRRDGKPDETSSTSSDSDSSSTSSGSGDGKPDETSESDSSSDSESSGTGDEKPNDLCYADKASTIPLLHKEYNGVDVQLEAPQTRTGNSKPGAYIQKNAATGGYVPAAADRERAEAHGGHEGAGRALREGETGPSGEGQATTGGGNGTARRGAAQLHVPPTL